MSRPGQGAQGVLCSQFSNEGFVPLDHAVRDIDRFLNLSDVRPLLAPLCSSGRRLLIDPELMIRMLLLGSCVGVRAERRLCEEVPVNPAYRWFIRLDLTDAGPDHATFSKIRHGGFREGGLFRHMFRTVLQRCMDEGLVGDEGEGSAEMLGWLVEGRKLAPASPSGPKRNATTVPSRGTPLLSTQPLTGHKCSAGKTLKTSRRKFSKPRATNVSKDGLIR